jgi:hypothetical protein
MKNSISAYTFDPERMYKGRISVQLCPVTGKDYLVPSDAVLDEPPKHDTDKEYPLREGDEWVIRPRLAGTYWHKETAKKIEISDPYSGDLDSYTKLEPPVHRPGDLLTFEKGAWAVALCNESIDELRASVFAEVKAETNRRIRTINGKEIGLSDWILKTQNYQDIKANYMAQLLSGQSLSERPVTQEQYEHAVSRLDRKDQYIGHYHTVLKPMVNAMTAEELQAFNPSKSEYWGNISA